MPRSSIFRLYFLKLKFITFYLKNSYFKHCAYEKKYSWSFQSLCTGPHQLHLSGGAHTLLGRRQQRSTKTKCPSRSESRMAFYISTNLVPDNYLSLNNITDALNVERCWTKKTSWVNVVNNNSFVNLNPCAFMIGPQENVEFYLSELKFFCITSLFFFFN